MPQATRTQQARSAYAGLDFIKAAFCPLEFNAMPFAEHPEYRQLCKDDALAHLEVGQPLHYPRQFLYTDAHGNRKRATQVVTAHFGCAPKDFDLFIGLYTYMKRLPERPADGRVHLTIDFLARQLSLPATCQKDYLRIRSRIFRFSFVKYTNSAFWNPETRSHDIVNFGFWNIAALSRIAVSRRPVTLDWDPTFLRVMASGSLLTFDYELYLTLSPALRRLYLIANRDGWNQARSSLFLADEFAVHQIGYSDRPEHARDRLYKLRRLLKDAEDLDLVRPCPEWKGYFQELTRGPLSGKLALRWTRGPRLRARPKDTGRVYTDRLENDALFAQVQELHDEHGKPLPPPVYRKLVCTFGRDKLQKHVAVVLAQKEHRPKSFTKSEVAAFIDRLQHDRPEPDWYRALQNAERLSPFRTIQPNQPSLDLYGTFFRD